ncbi:hypothetical protein BP5796_01371 [Coleophoma crateriformis]|uniref:Kinetochore protein Spc24 n=1 Tax=Coleophoma crateriformis TaxID=565419 RepID=A0A3D8T076_9HELO|nr:hypothetical protein BP5796_01371 [Coleophoma crateriformis]
MLLDEDPATLIHHTVGNFNIQPDKLAISRINESLSTLQQARDLRVREAESALKKLSRQLTTLHNHHDELVSSNSSAAHASEIATLDTKKFRIAKTANDLEIESERLSSQLADLQAKLQELELQGVDGRDMAKRPQIEDETSLKLKVYRSLGIDIERENGEYSKAIIRNAQKGDLHVVNMDSKFSKFFYANYFWNTL